MDFTLLAAFVVAVTLLSLAPGPDMLFIVANAVVGGRRAGIVAALGISAGLAAHTVAAAVGLGVLLQAAPAVLDGVRIVGAVFMLYLAVTTWWSSRGSGSDSFAGSPAVQQAPRRTIRRVYVMAMLTNLANPKIILFYLAFMPQFLTTGQDAWSATTQLLLLGAVFIVVGLAVDSSVGLLAGSMSERVLRRQSVRRWLDRACATIFGGLAVRLALDTR